MTCHEFWGRMPELGFDEQALQHARECPGCAALLDRQRALAANLRRVARQENYREAPARVERRLVEAFRAQAGAPVAAPATYKWPRWRVASLAAAVMVLGGLLLLRHPHPAVPPATAETAAAADPDSDFIPLPYAGEASSTEDADLIRVEMPRSALLALGVPVADGEAGEPVEAEVLLGMGGAPEAVRILQ